MSQFELVAQAREGRGKAVARRMRRLEDYIPAVVYGAGKPTQSIRLQHKAIFHALKNEALSSSILTLVVDGKAEKVVLKQVQRHAYKPKIIHVDFFRISAKEKITMAIPLHFVGEQVAPGAKQGGVFTKNITEINIRCLPANLPESIKVDVSQMAKDQTLHLSDIQLPAAVELAQAELDEAHDHPVISLHLPKVIREDVVTDSDAAAEEGSQGDTQAKAGD